MFNVLRVFSVFVFFTIFLSIFGCGGGSSHNGSRGNRAFDDGNRGQIGLPFISVWRTSSDNETVTLPLRGGYNYDFTVDWGDGSSSQVTFYDDTDITHTYVVAGDYTVTISGLVEAWYFSNSKDKDKIISVRNLGDVGWKNLEAAFFRVFKSGESQWWKCLWGYGHESYIL